MLEHIEISDFRSIRGTVELPLSSTFTLIHGPNGAGKTSILSALELALTEQLTGVVGASASDLVHRGRSTARIRLTTADGRIGAVDIDDQGIGCESVLESEEAKQFTERCYLPQALLSRLLDVYQHQEGRRSDSPLTRFVKELLGIDQLDALLDGLSPAGEIGQLRRLIPEIKVTEDRLRTNQDAAVGLARQLEGAEVQLRSQVGLGAAKWPKIAPEFTKLTATDLESVLSEPPALFLARGSEQSRWATLRQEIRATRELAEGLRVANAEEHRAGVAERLARAEQDLTKWESAAGQSIAATVEKMRKLPFGTFDVPSRTLAEWVQEARRRTSEAIAQSEKTMEAHTVASARLRVVRQETEDANTRRVAANRALDETRAAGQAEALVEALANLAPLIEGDDCPVCGRDFKEVSQHSLHDRLDESITALSRRAVAVRNLLNARDRERANLAELEAEARKLIPQVLSAAEHAAAFSDLESMRRLSGALLGHVAAAQERDHLKAAVVVAAGDLDAAQEALHAASLVRDRVRDIARRVGLAPEDELWADDTPAALRRLDEVVGIRIRADEAERESEIDAEQAVMEARGNAHHLLELRGRHASADRDRAAAKAKLDEMQRRLGMLRAVRRDAEKVRKRLVAQVFSESLNRTWRDLFIRLAPHEPFAPAFFVPEGTGRFKEARLETRHRDGSTAGAPGAMLSAGNLNTAALTLFLALNFSAGPDNPYLLLDDPVQSMDEVHIAQFAGVLRTLARDHGRRVVIAVHDRALFDYLSLELSPAAETESLMTAELHRVTSGASRLEVFKRTFVDEGAMRFVAA